MKKIKNILACLISSLILVSCSMGFNCEAGEGEMMKEERTVEFFNGIQVDFNAEVEYTQSERSSLEISANKNLMKFISTSVVDNILILETVDCDCVNPTDEIIIYVTGPELESLSIMGSGGITTKGLVQTKDLDCNINGSGDIIVEAIEMNCYDLDINGSGNITLGGQSSASCGNISISGSGDVNTKTIATDNVEVSIAGSGDVCVSAQKKLTVDIAGSGDVHYSGTPALFIDINGSGDIIKD